MKIISMSPLPLRMTPCIRCPERCDRRGIRQLARLCTVELNKKKNPDPLLCAPGNRALGQSCILSFKYEQSVCEFVQTAVDMFADAVLCDLVSQIEQAVDLSPDSVDLGFHFVFVIQPLQLAGRIAVFVNDFFRTFRYFP